MLAAVPVHHSWGSCSDHSGLGLESVRAVMAVARTLPFSSMRSALALVVETSIPRKSLRMLVHLKMAIGGLIEAVVSREALLAGRDGRL